MSNINLDFSNESVSAVRPETSRSSTIAPLLIILLVFLVYGALVLLNKTVSQKIVNLEGQYQSELSAMAANDIQEVLDFGNRSRVAKNLVKKEQVQMQILNEIEKSILPSVYLKAFSYDRKTKKISLECVGDSFNTVAKQTLSFKQSGYFQMVLPGESAVDQKNGQINFSIELTK